SSIANLVFGLSNGKWHVGGNQACHSGLSAVPGLDGRFLYDISESKVKPMYVLSGLQHSHSRTKLLTREMEICYLDWLLNKSIFAPCFETKDPEWCLDNECIIANAEQPANLLGAAMVT